MQQRFCECGHPVLVAYVITKRGILHVYSINARFGSPMRCPSCGRHLRCFSGAFFRYSTSLDDSAQAFPALQRDVDAAGRNASLELSDKRMRRNCRCMRIFLWFVHSAGNYESIDVVHFLTENVLQRTRIFP
jgi:hypothetical protein